jgi:sarcosine oxidase delta subunit
LSYHLQYKWESTRQETVAGNAWLLLVFLKFECFCVLGAGSRNCVLTPKAGLLWNANLVCQSNARMDRSRRFVSAPWRFHDEHLQLGFLQNNYDGYVGLASIHSIEDDMHKLGCRRWTEAATTSSTNELLNRARVGEKVI